DLPAGCAAWAKIWSGASVIASRAGPYRGGRLHPVQRLQTQQFQSLAQHLTAQAAEAQARLALRALGFQNRAGFIETHEQACQLVEIAAELVRVALRRHGVQHLAELHELE